MIFKQSIRDYIRAIGYFREGMPKLVLQVALMGLGVFFSVVSAFPLMILIDGVFTKNHQGDWANRLFFHFAPQSIPAQIIALAVITLLLRVAREVLSMVQTLLGIQAGYQGLKKVRCDLFAKFQELSLSYHRSQPQGDAIYRLSYDTLGFQTMMNLLVQTVLFSGFTLVMMLCVMFSFDWKLTLIALTIAPCLIWASVYYGKIFNEKTAAAKQAESQMTTAVQRSIQSIELVQAFNRESDELRHFYDTAGHSVQTWLQLHWEEVCYWLVIGIIFGVGGAAIFGYGGWLAWHDQFVLHNQNGFTVGKLYTFMMYLGQFYDPLNKLSTSGSSLQGAMVGVRRVFEVFDNDDTMVDAPDAQPLPVRARTLEFDHVSFAYRTGEGVLHEVSVRIEPGQMVAFVGSSGVGKTTLLNLLPRFYDPTDGALKLDGQDLRKIKLKDLRRHVALVLQENAILPASVAENIAYGRPNATPGQIARAAQLGGAAEFIEKLPGRYHAQLGERGSNLSGGQRQRIGIARALLTESPILVLDEPTSALDPRQEGMIVETLNGLKGQRTIIIVSHRLSTVRGCDQIFVMDGGRVAERGTHDQLLAMHGVYHDMAKQQFKIEDEAIPAGAREESLDETKL
jgi:ABC-type multidrug transport system fused ATPase/permease subunit